MKKLGIVFGILILMFVAAAVIIPLVVDVDKYRPQILEAANQRIQGKLELGKLSLSLWGQIRVEIAGLKLQDSSGREVVQVKDAYFHLPFLSVISGSPVLNFKMNQPTIRVVKDRTGKLNLMSLVKETPKSEVDQAPSGQTPPTAPAPSASNRPTGPSSLPAIATRARLGVEMRDAHVSYEDEMSGLNNQVKDLNLVLKDVSLSHPTELELWANLDTKLGNSFLLRGPARLTGRAQPDLRAGKIEQVSLVLKLDMDQVEMVIPGLFEKKKGIPTVADLSVMASEKEARIEKLFIKFFNAEMTARGSVTPLASASTSGSSLAGESSSPVVRFEVNSNEIELKPWEDLVPLLKDYKLGGSVRLEAGASGPAAKLSYHAKLALAGLTAKAPKLKVQPTFDGVINVLTDQIESILVTMKAPGNELKVKGKLVSFTKPKMDFEVTSSGMDLDQLIEFPPPAGSAQSARTQAPVSGGSTATQNAEQKADYDALLAPLRENKVLQDLVANVSINLKLLKAYQVKIQDISCKMNFKDLAAGMDDCGLKLFSGTITSDAHIQMKSRTPTYQFNAKVAGLNLGEAMASQMQLFKNTVMGTAHFKMNGQGASFNPDPAMSNLKAKGNLRVDGATFATLDVMKMVGDSLKNTLKQLGEKVPVLRGKSIGNLPNTDSKYEFISSDFSIADGKFSAPNFYAKAAPNKGIDLKGSTSVGLKDYSLRASWEVIDTYNLTQLRDLAVESNGMRVEHILTEANSPLRFPVSVNCTIKAPCYSNTEAASFLGKVAVNNVSHAMTGLAKEELRKKKEELRKKAEATIREMAPNAPAQIQDKLKGLFR